MSKPLSVKPHPYPRETLLSLVSRTAAMRGLSTWEFTAEIGLSQKRLIAVEQEMVKQIADLFDLTETQLEEITSWSPQPLAGVRMRFRGEDVVSRAVVNPTVRSCPACLREDISNAQHSITDNMVMRGEWQLRHVQACIKHQVKLVPLWTETHAGPRYDYALNLMKVADALQNDTLTAEPAQITDYDRWLDHRLRTGEDPTELAQHSIDVASNICCLLGDTRVKDVTKGLQASRPLPAARGLGFEAACRGTEAIRDALDGQAKRALDPQDEPNTVFHPTFRGLAYIGDTDERYSPFQDVVRDVVRNNWPVAPGNTVLGQPTSLRRCHSLRTAAAEAGISVPVMKRLMVYDGHVAAGDPRPDARLIMNAPQVAPLISEASQLVSAKEMFGLLGCSRAQFRTLVGAGVLTPRYPANLTRCAWDPQTAKMFIADLTHSAKAIFETDNDWEHIHRASARIRGGIDVLVNAARSGDLDVGKRTDLTGYAGIFVRKGQVDVTIRPDRPDMPTVAEFACIIGLNKSGHFNAMVEAGFVSTISLFNPQTRRNGTHIPVESAAAFYDQFTTAKLLSQRLNINSRVISQELRKAGIERFRPDGRDFGPVFRCEDVVGIEFKPDS